MSVPEFILDKMQSFIDDWTKGLQELIDRIAGAENENENVPFYITDNVYATTIIKTSQSEALNTGNAAFMLYTQDISIHDNIVATSVQPLGRCNFDNRWSSMTDEQRTATEISLNDYVPAHLGIIKNHEGSLRVTYGSSQADVTVVYGEPPVEHPTDIYRQLTTQNGTIVKNSKLKIMFNNVDYTVDSNGYIDVIPSNRIYSIHISEDYCRVLKGYPVLLNSNNTTFINNYINNNGSAHNYTGTYTTPGGETIDYYYGDNYIIINPSGDVSYDDVKHVLDISVTKINEDNDGDLIVPTYRENKYGPEPPEPLTDDDYIDMGLGVETDGMAMYNMAVITRDDLIQLITDFEANADTGLSFIPHVLGLYKLGIESSQLLTTEVQKIKLHKEPNGTSAFTSADDYNIVKDQLTVIDCGSITIDREELLTNTFYDYSPYSTYEMFIPGCGWITLPDTVVGRTISVFIVFDLTTCSCKGIVRSEGQLLGGNGTTLATVNGIIGSSVPLSINETGLQRAAIFNGSTQAAMALGTAFLGVGIGNPYMGASGVAMAAGALADNHVAGNTTYTNTKGGATDYSIFGDGYKAVLKITRPVVEIPDNYGHTVGFVVNEYGMLSDFHGFTVCVNPHIHISATSDEKEEIKRLLESGVILPDGE